MDRFVIRTPTWKTLNYSSMTAKSYAQKSAAVTMKKTLGDNRKKPLQQKQLCEVTAQTYDFDKRLEDLLPSFNQANAENFNGNSNDSGLSSASSISPQQIDDNVLQTASPYEKHLGKLADYIDCPVEKENETYMTITRSLRSHNKVGVESAATGAQVQKTLDFKNTLSSQVQGTPDRPIPMASSMIMARIQRDLNSPSAAARMKALKAMKSPTKSAYSHFDIPEAEQSLHLPEPPSLQEIMRNIVVYVEVRSGEDNRSAGVRKVIEALGARVNLSLNRYTTHVIFKDGLMSTFKKATQMNVPIVSILWIEACKTQRRICDPKDYPISNLDRYENPELYTKMKRVKSMQPDSECNKRIRAKTGGTPKDSTPTQKTGKLKKTSTFIGGTPTSSTNKKKTDISQFFKKLDQQTPSSSSKLVDGSGDITIIPESPATQLLNRIHSECYTPLDELKKKGNSKENNIVKPQDNDRNPRANMGAKKVLDFLQKDEVVNTNQENSVNTRSRRYSMSMQQKSVVEIKAAMEVCVAISPAKRSRTRRHSLNPVCEVEIATSSLNTMAISATPNKTSTRRRSSIHTPKDMSVALETPSKVQNIEPILEEANEAENVPELVATPKSVGKRRTLYNLKTMDQTEFSKDIATSNTRANSRRTLYSNKTIETTETTTFNEIVNKVSGRPRTCFSVKTLDQMEITETHETPARKTGKSAGDHKTGDNDIEMQTPVVAKVDKPSSHRRTLFGAPNTPAADVIIATPTLFQMSKVVSSTLLEDSGSRSQLLATPPADATSGKLLEETEQCATPLVFSSTRQPGNKRRTLFDVSMDIITQRLQCINQSARKSLAPPTPSAELGEKSLNTPISNTIRTLQTSNESLNECLDSNDGMGVMTPDPNTLKKKRKLFMPNEIMATPPTTAAASSDEVTKETITTTDSNSVTKRRRTLMPISQPQPTTLVTVKNFTASSGTSSGTTSSVKKRRSTLDFEQIQRASATAPKSSSQHSVKAKKPPVLVYTNMHQQQIDVIREVGKNPTTTPTPTKR